MCKATVAWKKIDRDLGRPLIDAQPKVTGATHPPSIVCSMVTGVHDMYRCTLREHFEQEALCKGIVENKDATTKY